MQNNQLVRLLDVKMNSECVNTIRAGKTNVFFKTTAGGTSFVSEGQYDVMIFNGKSQVNKLIENGKRNVTVTIVVMSITTLKEDV